MHLDLSTWWKSEVCQIDTEWKILPIRLFHPLHLLISKKMSTIYDFSMPYVYLVVKSRFFQKTQGIVTKFGNEKSKLTYSNLSNLSFALIILKIIKVFSLNNFWYILHDVLGLKYASNFSFQGSFFWLQGALIPWSLSQVQVLN